MSEGYSYKALGSNYAGVKQRWLVIHSQQAAQQAQNSLKKRLLKHADKDMTLLNKLSKTSFQCQEDAKSALTKLQAQLKILHIPHYCISESKHFARPGRPKKDAPPTSSLYTLELYPALALDSYEKALRKASTFIIATDVLDEQELNDADILKTYKQNSKVEKGFGFLKDPMFLASTLFLKKVERLIALLMVMTLCLLVYSAIQYRTRATLQTHNLSIPDQKGKPTQNPTARWLFELFQGVHLIRTDSSQPFTLNLHKDLFALLNALGKPYLLNYPNSS